MSEIDTVITYALQHMKKRKIDNFLLVDVAKIHSQNSYEVRYEFCGKFPDKEIAYYIEARDVPENLKLIAEQAVDGLQEWFGDAASNPRIKEKEQKWINGGKPLIWPISEDVQKIQKELEI